MSKYIIDIPESVKKIVYFHVGNANAIWTTSNILDDLEELNSDYINEHFGDLQDEAYKRGFEDGKAVNDKGCDGCKYEGGTVERNPCFTCCNYYQNYWTAKKQDDEIKVGDEVRSTYEGRVIEEFTPWVVTLVTSETCYGFDADGKQRSNPNTSVQKTGRHFDIDKILREMNE